MISIKVQAEDFDVGEAYQALATNVSTGAVVFFVGLVRDQNLGESVFALELEHYPGMTEQSLQQIAEQAAKRWPIADVSIIHRVGKLALNEQIVFVGVNAKHRLIDLADLPVRGMDMDDPLDRHRDFQPSNGTGPVVSCLAGILRLGRWNAGV